MILYPNETGSVKFTFIEVQQPIGPLYLASINAKDLYDISFADVRRIESEERGFETYLGIQRPLNQKRVKEIKEYASTYDASYPTSIIIAVDSRCVEVNGSIMTLRSFIDEETGERVTYNQIAKIIDGQHRLAGLEDYQGPRFDIPVSIFIDMDLADQAHIFSTVNLAQTKVNKSLAYDLFEYATHRSPQKVAHNIAVALNLDPKSPFYKRIKRLGVASQSEVVETLTQAAVVENIMKYITKNAAKDRDLLRRGKTPDNKTTDHSLIFRGLFILQKDIIIADIIRNYFEAVRLKYPDAWKDTSKGASLSKTNAFMALMRLLPIVLVKLGINYQNIRQLDAAPTVAKFQTVIQYFTIPETSLTVQNYKPGSSGASALYKDLLRDIEPTKQQ